MYENAYFGMIPDPFTIEHYRAENPGREEEGEEEEGREEEGRGREKGRK